MILKIFVYLCVLVAIEISCNEDLEDRLIGASAAGNNEFPFSVSIRFGLKHICGAALINKRYVLTAAHCVHSLKKHDISKINVLVGTNNLLRGGQTYNVTSMSQDPQYIYTDGPSWKFDIGLLKLSSDVKFSDQVAPINLPTRESKPGDQAVVVGWGSPFRNVPPTPFLRKLHVHVISREKCLKIMPDIVEVHKYQLCTYDSRDVGTCLGDSGGPLIANNTIIGVVSGGIPCALGYPDVYTGVANFRDYINSEIEK